MTDAELNGLEDRSDRMVNGRFIQELIAEVRRLRAELADSKLAQAGAILPFVATNSASYVYESLPIHPQNAVCRSCMGTGVNVVGEPCVCGRPAAPIDEFVLAGGTELLDDPQPFCGILSGVEVLPNFNPPVVVFTGTLVPHPCC